jgi:uncharacterized membrane protein
MLLAPRLDPAYANYEQFWLAWTAVRTSVMVALAVIQLTLMQAATGAQAGLTSNRLVLVIGLMLVVAGTFMGKIRPNVLVGIRTPWTLASKASWVRTHRLGGWLSLMTGVLFIVAGIMASDWTVLAAVVCGTVALAWLIVYSYLVWRDDPVRISALSARPATPD